jgi:hypothetical protein
MTIVDQCLLDLGLFFYSFSLFYPLRNAQVCVHYLEINVLTAVINIGVLASILFKFISMLDS